jgi:CheY-like chemotaxis protein
VPIDARLQEFKDSKPRAVVLEDEERIRRSMARALSNVGFEVAEAATVQEFREVWSPGMFDVIVADWDLARDSKGDQVLEEVRTRDWDVPFVLVSGRLDEDDEKAAVLSGLLESGSARFVEKGDGGIEKACTQALELIDRRDLALLRVVLRFREGALQGKAIKTSSGKLAVRELLEELVRDPQSSHDGERPIADRISDRLGRT